MSIQGDFVFIETFIFINHYLIYKPFQVLSQFTSTEGKLCLKDIVEVPKDVYPIGRLDYDSEGLLFLSNDSKLNHQLLHPKFEHARIYWVQVEGEITHEAIAKLTAGVSININGVLIKTKPARLALLEAPVAVPERNPPIRYRKNIPTPWVEIELIEGKNRQVRKMFASVQFPVLRLIRAQIGVFTIQGMMPGDLISLSPEEVQEGFFR
ncbi:MAG: pseudouridine synthase [Bacteroidetes bacterium]|nr:pseudouridine synthase [Bacteroidota bacterium]